MRITAAGIPHVRGNGRGDQIIQMMVETPKKLNKKQKAIIKANNLKPPFILYEGDKIIIPANKIYIVKGGDTLWDIAECYGVTVIIK